MRFIGWVGLLVAMYLIFYSDSDDRYLGYLLVFLSMISLYRDYIRRNEYNGEEEKIS